MFSLLDRQGAGTINAQSAVLAFSLLMPVAADEKLLYSFLVRYPPLIALYDWCCL
jgi:hypothetical protein